MESDLSGRQFEFSTVVEYFTKRGKPLTPAEIGILQEEDRQEREFAELE